jgi:hypothetical protein
MGNVIDFPVGQRLSAQSAITDPADAGTVIILPVVRVERGPDMPSDGIEPGSGNTAGRKRRRRARA